MYRHNSIDVTLMLDDVAAAYRRAKYEVRTLPHVYSSDILSLAVNEPIDQIADARRFMFEMDDDSFFVWLAILIHFTDDDHPSVAWGSLQSCYASIHLTVRLESSHYFIVGPVPTPMQVFSGVGEAAHLFGYPTILAPGERVRVGFQAAEETGDIQVTLWGAKLYTTPFTRQVIQPGH